MPTTRRLIAGLLALILGSPYPTLAWAKEPSAETLQAGSLVDEEVARATSLLPPSAHDPARCPSLFGYLAEVASALAESGQAPPSATSTTAQPAGPHGTLLYDDGRYRLFESVQEDPTTPSTLARIQRLTLVDNLSGRPRRTEEMVPGQFLVSFHPERARGAATGTTPPTPDDRAAARRSRVSTTTHDQWYWWWTTQLGHELSAAGLMVQEEVADGVALVADPQHRPLMQLLADPTVRALRERGYLIEPNAVLHLLGDPPNDPEFPKLWGLQNTGQSLPVARSFHPPQGIPGIDLNARKAWERWTGDRNVLIGVIDTGINYSEPDLAANIWTNPGEIPDNGKDDDGNGYVDDVHGYDFVHNDGDPMDDHGHGTHVTGTIAGVGNNALKIVGVMHKARIVALKFLSGSGSGTLANAVRAIDYATAVGCAITSNSWGGGGYSQALYDAIQRAQARDALFIAAAGNNGQDSDTDPAYPAAYDLPNIIAVAAIDARGRLAPFSNYGATSVDLGAPGVQILSLVKDGSMKWLDGTSMATPHVTGVAGLMRSFNPEVTAQAIRRMMLNTVTPLNALAGKTTSGGLVNAGQAVEGVIAGVVLVFTRGPIPGDGYASPGKTVDVALTLQNVGYRQAQGVQATLTASDPLVTVLTPVLDYGILSVEAPVRRTARVAIAQGMPTGREVTLMMDVRMAGVLSVRRTFTLTVYRVGTIQLRVTKAIVGTPVAGAKVMYKGTAAGNAMALEGSALSDADGRCPLTLPYGTYTLTAASPPGLVSLQRRVDIPPENQEVNVMLGAPQIDVPPLELQAPAGTRVTRALAISNARGTLPLIYTIPDTTPAPTGAPARIASVPLDPPPAVTGQGLLGWRGGLAWDAANPQLWSAVSYSKISAPYARQPRLQRLGLNGEALWTAEVTKPGCDTPESNRRALHGFGLDAQGRLWGLSATDTNPREPNGCYDPLWAETQYALVRIDPNTQPNPQIVAYYPRLRGQTSQSFVVRMEKNDFVVLEAEWYLDGNVTRVRDVFARLGPDGQLLATQELPPPLQRTFTVGTTWSYQMAWDGKDLWAAWLRVVYGSNPPTVVGPQLLRMTLDGQLRVVNTRIYDLGPFYRDSTSQQLERYVWGVNLIGPGLLALSVPSYSSEDPTTYQLDLFSVGIPWLTIEPSSASGEIPIGQTKTSALTIDTTNLAPGSYEGTIAVRSNDPDEPIKPVLVKLTVTSPSSNAAPVANPDAYSVKEDTPLTVSAPGVLGNDSDVEGDPLTAVRVTGPTHGTLALNSNGNFTYTPNADFDRTDSFTYKANDAQADSNLATATITVIAVNDPPTISDIADQRTAVNTATGALPFTVGDVETPAGSLTVTGASSNTALVPNGQIVFGGSGASRTVTVTPAANQSGTATITVTVKDGDGATASDSFVLTVNQSQVPSTFTWNPDPNQEAPVVYSSKRGYGIFQAWADDPQGNPVPRNGYVVTVLEAPPGANVWISFPAWISGPRPRGFVQLTLPKRGTYKVSIKATSGNGAWDTRRYAIRVL